MPPANGSLETLADVQVRIEKMNVSALELRRMKTSIKRISQMAGASPSSLSVDAQELRKAIVNIHPAAHDVRASTFRCYRSELSRALRLVGALDHSLIGLARNHSAWAPLLAALGDMRARSLSGFANWCVTNDVLPTDVNEAVARRYLHWRETRTLSRYPRNCISTIFWVWNRARETVDGWPDRRLDLDALKPPQKWLSWDELNEEYCRDAESYLKGLAQPDLFDPNPHAPRRPLSKATLSNHRRSLGVAASVLIQSGYRQSEVSSLSDIVRPEAFRIILSRIHDIAGGQVNSRAKAYASLLLRIARHHVRASAEQVRELEAISAKLPRAPYCLKEKDRALLRRFESDRLRARLLFLPESLQACVDADLARGRIRYVLAQVAVAVDIILVAPMAPQNFIGLNWGQHFRPSEGKAGELILHVPASETRLCLRDATYVIPPSVASRIEWYRHSVLKQMGCSADGYLFVTKSGRRKKDTVMTRQIQKVLADEIGYTITLSQFRHLAALFYLERHPGDFETLRALLGIAQRSTTQRYEGLTRRIASRAYTDFVIQKRAEMLRQDAQ